MARKRLQQITDELKNQRGIEAFRLIIHAYNGKKNHAKYGIKSAR